MMRMLDSNTGMIKVGRVLLINVSSFQNNKIEKYDMQSH